MPDSCEPLRILSLDGGGIRGISSLLILERIMEKIREVKCLDQVPRPCEHFDLIGGTSTGGIIAIMLGRLGMSTDECIRAYRKVAEKAFTPKGTSFMSGRPKGKFSARSLEDAMKEIVREYCTSIECVTRRREGHATIETCPHSDMAFRDHTCKKTAVLAITKDNVDAPPTLFRTYDSSTAFETSTLWQVARATSAATTFFKSIKVGRDGIEYADAGFGYNNPCDILTQEAQRVYPERQTMRILSIGTGLGDVVTIKNSRLSILDALKKMATSSKKVAASMDHRYGDSGEYYRFNVEHGLQDITLSDWDKTSVISAHTRNYLAENDRRINRFIENFLPYVGSVNRNVANSIVNDIAQTISTPPDTSDREACQNARTKDDYKTQPLSQNPGHDLPESQPLLPFFSNGMVVGRNVGQVLLESQPLPFSKGMVVGNYSITRSETQPYPERWLTYRSFQEPERRTKSKLRHGCSTCRSRMHHSQDCPWTGKDYLRCFCCRQFGHYKDECRPYAPCRKCGSKGHWEKNCFYDEGDGGCFNCGQYDHWVQECRWKKQLE